jgi:predicted permease
VSAVRAFISRLGGLARRGEREREFAAEVEAHLQMQIEDNLRDGMTDHEARRQALIRFGGVEQTKEDHRERRGLPWLDAVWQDVRFGLRMLRKNPGFALAALLTLALGIGANTAIFSVVNTTLLRPLPYADADRIVHVWHVPPPQIFHGQTKFSVSPANYLDWQNQNHVFDRMAAMHFDRLNLSDGDRPEALDAVRVGAEFFSVLGVAPRLGRGFLKEEDAPGRDKVVVLGHGVWQSRFGADRDIVGRQIRLNGQPHTVVGVMPAGFQFPDGVAIWLPLAWTDETRAVRGNHNDLVIARLAPGVELATAQAEMDMISLRLAQQYPEDDKDWGAIVVPLREELVGEVRPALLVLFGAVVFLLLIACANVANLGLARTLARKREMALRAALGASRRRVLQQMLCEALLLALAGGALGLLVADVAVSLMVALLADKLPRASEIRLDGAVLAFTLGLSIFTALAAGIAPAWRLTKTNLNDALKQEAGRTASDSGGNRTRSVLVVSEVALSLVLLVGAGLMIRTLFTLRNVDPGFDPRDVSSMTLSIPPEKYASDAQQVAFFDRVLGRVRTLPGVESAAAIDTLPLAGGGSMQPIAIDGYPVVAMSEQPEVAVREISTEYLRAMRVPLLRGRDFSAADRTDGASVVLVSESMAKRFWPNEDPIGKRLVLSFYPGISREIIGIVGDVKLNDLARRDAVPTLYNPLAQVPRESMTLVVRSKVPPAAMTAAVKSAVREIDAEQPVVDIATLDDVVRNSYSQQRFSMQLLAAFAAFALVLAGIGIYGVLAYTVRRRTREIGIRVALGARKADVAWMVLGQGMRLALAGLVIGTLLALGLTRLLAGLLFGVEPIDPLTFVAVTALLAGISLVACYLPARRAMRIAPMTALRLE